MTRILLSILALMLAAAAQADEAQVRLPLEAYQRLVHTRPTPRPAPAGYALGQANVTVVAREDDQGRVSALVEVAAQVDVLEDEWTVVPVMPAGTAVEETRVGNDPVRLLATPDGLAWATAQRGRYALYLRYRIDAQRFESGTLLAIPVPQAAATSLQATLPGSQLEVAVVPAAGVQTSEVELGTEVRATVPSTGAVQISWSTPRSAQQSISRAAYNGTLDDEVVRWTAELEVDLSAAGLVTLPLLPASVTLSDVRVDGKPAPIVVVGEQFATRLQGRGAHTVVATFQVRVEKENGPPTVRFAIPQIPVSRFDLTMLGTKELKTSPAGGVTYVHEKDRTVATAYVPMTNIVELTWAEAVPDIARTEKRVNATFFHAAHAEEGVLHDRVTASYEVTRGEINVLEVEVPADAQVSRVADAAGVITDWRMAPAENSRPRLLTVFLDRQLSGNFSFDIDCERSLGRTPLEVPFLRATNVQRQRGMVALLSSKELTLNPAEEQRLTRVGENQIPAELREAIRLKVAHTFKYSEDNPRLVVTATAPERQQGKFDVQTDTLVSLADVTLRGSLSIEVNVKSGTLSDLTIELPARVNLLSLTAPSMRDHTVSGAEARAAAGATSQSGERLIAVEFTQEMEGQFRIELAYERILGEEDAEVAVPAIRVRGAEVEQGRIAVEALSVMEVRAGTAAHLTSLDPSELPRQLVLKTTNPILLAYKYVQAEPAPELRLAMTRHRAIEVRAATIDEAVYRTLFTADGLAVTAAALEVRNSREQFLRLRLPERAEVWSVFVNGVPEKPAVGADGEILVKIITSAQGFPVQLVYSVPVAEMGLLGRVSGELPKSEIVTTRTRWEVYLPDRHTYGRMRGNLTMVEDAAPMSAEALRSGFAKLAATGDVVAPLRIDVPASGVRYVFTKLYASQAAAVPMFSVAYASAAGGWMAHALSGLGAALAWFALWRAVNRRRTLLAAAIAAVAVALVAIITGYLGLGERTAAVTFIAIGIGVAITRQRSAWSIHPAQPTSANPAP